MPKSTEPAPFDPDNPQPDQFYGYGATAVGTESGQFAIDPDTGLLLAAPTAATPPPAPPTPPAAPGS